MIFRKLDFKNSRYDRPTSPYRCGEQCATRCALGPNADGTCRGGTECLPRREGDRWFCSRNGKPCEEGPDQNGQCCNVIYCIPEPNYRSLRQSGLFWMFAISLSLLVLCLGWAGRSDWFSPGPLASHHAVVKSMDCSGCHVDNPQTGWVEKVFHSMPASGCADCHGFSDKAEFPHNRIDFAAAEPVSCALCHNEHQGDSHLMQSTADQCESCHNNFFQSRTTAHAAEIKVPDDRSRIHFDHGKHFSKYYKQAKVSLLSNCTECHAAGTQQLFAGTYEKTCSQCHDKIFSEREQKVEFVAIPNLDTETLMAKGIGVGAWPQDMEDSHLSPLTLANITGRNSPAFVKALKSNTIDLADLSAQDDSQLQEVQKTVVSFKEYLLKIRQNPYQSLTNLPRPYAQENLQTLDAVIDRLFPDLEAEVTAFASGAVVPTRDVAVVSNTEEDNLSPWMLEGNVIKMQSMHHKDTFVMDWIGVLNNGGNLQAIDAAKAQFFSGDGWCIKCHKVSESQIPRLSSSQFLDTHLKFRHEPHLRLLSNDCGQCHAANSNHRVISSATCFSCHDQKKSALNDCQTCHNYHSKQSP